MRIVILPNVFWPHYGGVVTATHNVCKHLASDGHIVSVVVHSSSPTLPRHEGRDGYEIHRIRLSSKNKIARLWVFPSALFRMYRLFRSLRPDIVHVQILHINTLYSVLLSYVLPYRLVLRAGGNDIHKFPVESRLMKFILLWGFRRAHQIQFNSRNLLEDAAPFLTRTRGEIVIVGDGADPDELVNATGHTRPSGRPYVFAAGRLEHKKGFDILIDAFTAVKRVYPDMELVIAGDGEDMGLLQERVSDRGLTDSVFLIGAVGRDALATLFQGSRLFVLPSRIEPVGIVTMEAMSTGKPVVATRVGGVPDIVEHGLSGWLVEPNDRSLAEGILRVLSDEALMERMAQAGMRRIRERFTWRHVADQYLGAYERIRG
jgi:glycogen synthase